MRWLPLILAVAFLAVGMHECLVNSREQAAAEPQAPRTIPTSIAGFR